MTKQTIPFSETCSIELETLLSVIECGMMKVYLCELLVPYFNWHSIVLDPFLISLKWKLPGRDHVMLRLVVNLAGLFCYTRGLRMWTWLYIRSEVTQFWVTIAMNYWALSLHEYWHYFLSIKLLYNTLCRMSYRYALSWHFCS